MDGRVALRQEVSNRFLLADCTMVCGSVAFSLQNAASKDKQCAVEHHDTHFLVRLLPPCWVLPIPPPALNPDSASLGGTGGQALIPI